MQIEYKAVDENYGNTLKNTLRRIYISLEIYSRLNEIARDNTYDDLYFGEIKQT